MCKMVNITLLVSFVLLRLTAKATSTLISSYEQTIVFEELTTCKTNPYYDLLEETPVSSRLSCGVACSNNDNCRRFMFDQQTRLCSLFGSGENCFDVTNIEDKVCYRQKYICKDSSCSRCPIGYYGNQCEKIIPDCNVGYTKQVLPAANTLAYIQPKSDEPPFELKCKVTAASTLIVYRDSRCTEIDFNRTWDEYSTGFGRIHSEYWIGLQNIYNILQNYPTFQLVVKMKDSSGNSHRANYRTFGMSNSADNYRINIGDFYDHPGAPLGNSLTKSPYSITGRPFSTYDRDYSNNDCPGRFKGGWWYVDDPECCRANLIGRRVDADFEATMHWLDTLGNRNDYIEIIVRIARK